MKISISGRPLSLAERAWEAATFWQRALGLWRLPRLRAGEGLYLKACNWVHTLGLAYAIDTVHLDAQQRVVACETLKPGSIGRWVRAGVHVLELPAGTVQKTGCQIGDQLELE